MPHTYTYICVQYNDTLVFLHHIFIYCSEQKKTRKEILQQQVCWRVFLAYIFLVWSVKPTPVFWNMNYEILKNFPQIYKRFNANVLNNGVVGVRGLLLHKFMLILSEQNLRLFFCSGGFRPPPPFFSEPSLKCISIWTDKRKFGFLAHFTLLEFVNAFYTYFHKLLNKTYMY